MDVVALTYPFKNKCDDSHGHILLEKRAHCIVDPSARLNHCDHHSRTTLSSPQYKHLLRPSPSDASELWATQFLARRALALRLKTLWRWQASIRLPRVGHPITNYSTFKPPEQGSWSLPSHHYLSWITLLTLFIDLFWICRSFLSRSRLFDSAYMSSWYTSFLTLLNFHWIKLADVIFFHPLRSNGCQVELYYQTQLLWCVVSFLWVILRT